MHHSVAKKAARRISDRRAEVFRTVEAVQDGI